MASIKNVTLETGSEWVQTLKNLGFDARKKINADMSCDVYYKMAALTEVVDELTVKRQHEDITTETPFLYGAHSLVLKIDWRSGKVQSTVIDYQDGRPCGMYWNTKVLNRCIVN